MHRAFEDIGDAVHAMQIHVRDNINQLPTFQDSSGQSPTGNFPTTVEVAMPFMFESLQTGSSHLYAEVARHTQMAAHLQELAQACIDRMDTADQKLYVGIHLRIEEDFEALNRTGGKPLGLLLESKLHSSHRINFAYKKLEA